MVEPRAIKESDIGLLIDYKETRLCILTQFRVDPNTLPRGWYVYDVRGDIYSGTIEPHANINWDCCIITCQPFQFADDNDQYIQIEDDDIVIVEPQLRIKMFMDLKNPDPNYSLQEMLDFGYRYDGMFLIGPVKAKELSSYYGIMQLHPDDTESEAKYFSYFGHYGVSKLELYWAALRQAQDEEFEDDD